MPRLEYRPFFSTNKRHLCTHRTCSLMQGSIRYWAATNTPAKIITGSTKLTKDPQDTAREETQPRVSGTQPTRVVLPGALRGSTWCVFDRSKLIQKRDRSRARQTTVSLNRNPQYMLEILKLLTTTVPSRLETRAYTTHLIARKTRGRVDRGKSLPRRLI